jgi:hypothetical protein
MGFISTKTQVSYSNRFVRSHSFCEAMDQGRIARGEFMTNPCRTMFGRVMTFFNPKPSDNTNVNVSVLDEQLVALTETPLPIRFDPRTLKTMGHIGFDSAVKGQVSTAHPHSDGASSYFYTIDMGRRSTYRLFTDKNGSQSVLAELPVEQPSYMHSFGMSEHYLILTEFPLRVNPLRLAFSSQPFIRNYRWDPKLGTMLTVVDKTDGSGKAGPTGFLTRSSRSSFRTGTLKRSGRGPKTVAMQVNPSSSRGQTATPKMMGFCSRSSSMRRRDIHFCSCLMRRPSRSRHAPPFRITFPSGFTEITLPMLIIRTPFRERRPSNWVAGSSE